MAEILAGWAYETWRRENAPEMTDVYISHAGDELAACKQIADALSCVGLAVSWETSTDEQSIATGGIDKAIHAASATIVLWSMRSAESDPVSSSALCALGIKPKVITSSASRYLGIIIDEIEPQLLPLPFNGMEVPRWATWFAVAPAMYDDQRFLALLTSLESLTGKPHLIATAKAVASRDVEVQRLKAEMGALDETHAQLKAENNSLTLQLAEQAAELNERARTSKEAHDQLKILERDAAASTKLARELAVKSALVSEQATKIAAFEKSLQLESEALAAAQLALSIANERIATSVETEQAKDRELEDARLGLAVALRQHKVLQAQVDASDQIIREIMTQREGLIATRDKLEKENEKTSTQLSDTSRRLFEIDAKRSTYESALVERTREIQSMEEQVSSFSAELGELRPRAESLSTVVKSWGHVPWRAIAAGSLAAGAVMSYGAITGGQALDAWLSSRSDTAVNSTPVAGEPLSDGGSATQKVEAKIGPDSLSSAEARAPNAFEVLDLTTSNDGAIAIPNDSEAPVSNDQVEFNPEGLPPVEPDSRPPPQDLPPMQQKPKLLLKPAAPLIPQR